MGWSKHFIRIIFIWCSLKLVPKSQLDTSNYKKIIIIINKFSKFEKRKIEKKKKEANTLYVTIYLIVIYLLAIHLYIC